MARSTSSAHNLWPREEFKLSNTLEVNIFTRSRFPFGKINYNEQLQTCSFFRISDKTQLHSHRNGPPYELT